MKNSVKFKGREIFLRGTFPKIGETAPDFKLAQGDLTDFTLADAGGKKTVLNIFPSLDTSVCAMSVRKFNEMAAKLGNVEVLCISKDLPFAQNRFCVAEGIANVTPLSDCRADSRFGEDYGVLIESGALCGLLARAVVVIDKNGKVAYAALNAEIAEEPDYARVLDALA